MIIIASKKEVNEEFFDVINEESAYFLGCLFADASIYRGTGRRHEIIISSPDYERLEMIRDHIGSDQVIRQKTESGWQLRFGSRHMEERLVALGLTENKTLNLQYPDLPPEMERHFIRGYFEGKGGFIVEPGRRIISNFTGACETFIEELRDRLVILGLSPATVHRYGNNSTSQLRYYVKDTRRLYNALYREARIYSSDERARYEGGYRI